MIAEEGALQTQIMYRANLSFTKLKEYLVFMLRIGLLKMETTSDRSAYFTTDKGSDFLHRYKEVTGLLQEGARVEREIMSNQIIEKNRLGRKEVTRDETSGNRSRC